jgi:predicted amidohydrolase YtcJ
MKSLCYSIIVFNVLVACSAPDNETQDSVFNSAMYFGGDIITMEGDQPTYAEAVVTEDNTIVFVGTQAEAEENYANARLIDLAGKTMLPGFFDGHIHFSALGGQAVVANLLAEPDGVVNDIPALLDELREWHEANGTDKTNGWIVGMGFDDAVLAEGRFPTKADLDQVSTELPICIIHISGHFCSMNSKGLEMNGITAETPDPEGGIIRRVAGSNEPNGVLEELAAIPLFFPILTPRDTATSDYFLDEAQKSAASFGYTTVQEGRAMKSTHDQLVSYAEREKLYLDVVSYIDYTAADLIDSEWYGPTYQNGYRIGGMKLTLDGSPQGRTAWRTEPYLIPPEGADNDYAGYPAIPQDSVVQRIVNQAFENDWQLLTHANGDAAVDQLLRCMRPAIDTYGNDDRRHVLIHGQYVRMDQMDSLATMDIIPSLFPMHTFYWGDWHTQLIGEEKAQNISPMRTALGLGLKPTSHTDAPVALPNLMMVLWATVNRETRSGKTLGPDQRLTPYEALKTITIWGARQHFEEDIKGTLEAGKLADLVILDKNPLKVDPSELLNIQVLETIKEGNTIYQRD